MQYLTDEIGAAQASKYNLTKEYWTARKQGCNIIEALEDWDLIDDEFREKYSSYCLPSPTLKELISSVWYFVRYPFLKIYYKIKIK